MLILKKLDLKAAYLNNPVEPSLFYERQMTVSLTEIDIIRDINILSALQAVQ